LFESTETLGQVSERDKTEALAGLCLAQRIQGGLGFGVITVMLWALSAYGNADEMHLGAVTFMLVAIGALLVVVSVKFVGGRAEALLYRCDPLVLWRYRRGLGFFVATSGVMYRSGCVGLSFVTLTADLRRIRFYRSGKGLRMRIYFFRPFTVGGGYTDRYTVRVPQQREEQAFLLAAELARNNSKLVVENLSVRRS
jgi:hypothetical protein